jgi:hypothetical protein
MRVEIVAAYLKPFELNDRVYGVFAVERNSGACRPSRRGFRRTNWPSLLPFV